jgi:hypothetical protein
LPGRLLIAGEALKDLSTTKPDGTHFWEYFSSGGYVHWVFPILLHFFRGETIKNDEALGIQPLVDSQVLKVL